MLSFFHDGFIASVNNDATGKDIIVISHYLTKGIYSALGE